MSGIHFGSSHFHPIEIRRTAERPTLPLSSVPAAWKLAVLLILVGGTVALPLHFWLWHLGVALFLGALVVLVQIPLRALLLRLLLLAPFIAGAALAVSFHPGQGPGWQTVMIRGMLCVTAVSIFGALTPLGELPRVLRRWRVPALLVTTLTLMHRYLFVLSEEAERMRRARASRTLTRGRRFTWLLSADVIGRLFVRASERAERIYLAMCARGWK
jgi:cobalt/nickel transport system permease protein